MTKQVKRPKPTQGERMWVTFFNANVHTDTPYSKKGECTASVQMRIFERAEPHYLGKRNNERWILIMEGKPYGQGYGMAWKPEHVFDCKLAAEKYLQNRMLDKITQIEDKMKELEI